MTDYYTSLENPPTNRAALSLISLEKRVADLEKQFKQIVDITEGLIKTDQDILKNIDLLSKCMGMMNHEFKGDDEL